MSSLQFRTLLIEIANTNNRTHEEKSVLHSFIPIKERLFALAVKPRDIIELKIMTIAMLRINLFKIRTKMNKEPMKNTI